MADQFTITIAAGGDDAEARAFSAVLRDVLDILETLGKEQLGTQPTWRIVGLTKNSPPSVTLECRDTSGIGKRVVDGWREIQRAPSRPFPPRAMRATRRLGRRIAERQVDAVTANAPDAASVQPTESLSTNAERALSEKYYTAPSSVDGKLDVVNVHRRAKFSVFDELHHREVRCHFPQSLFEEVKRYLGKRVSVIGIVRFDTLSDRPLAVKVENIEPLDEAEAKPMLFSEMGRIDLTGGLSSEEYMRRLRDGSE